MWPFRRRVIENKEPPAALPPRKSLWSTEISLPALGGMSGDQIMDARIEEFKAMAPKALKSGETMVGDDSFDDGVSSAKMMGNGRNTSIGEVLASWYGSQGFIGYQMCGILAQHWLINKVCGQPGRDATRKWFVIQTLTGKELDPQLQKGLQVADKRYGLRRQLEEYSRKGRIFGVRIAFAKFANVAQEFYELPFNPDAIKPGSYRGIVQVDPYWTSPMLDQAAASDSDSMYFYEPTWWIINGKRYHRSHLIIMKTDEPTDILKPAYIYGGVPIPQQIMERVYAAERTANEAPQLAMSKRTTVWLTNMAEFLAKGADAVKRLQDWIIYRDNYDVKLGDKEQDDIQQFDTSLGDLDVVIMTQYQLVAAAGRVPATKLMGTSPKGFGASGEYESQSYHEELESHQAHDLTPLVERHHLCVLRSDLNSDIVTQIMWEQLDSPTEAEAAATNKIKAETAAIYIQNMVFDASVELQRLEHDPSSDYSGLGLTPPEIELEPLDDENQTGQD